MARKFNVDGADWLAEKAADAAASQHADRIDVVLTRMSDGYKYRASIAARDVEGAPEALLRAAVRGALAAS
jgi:hypothetical protein